MYKNFINHLIKKSDLQNTDYFTYNENRAFSEKKVSEKPSFEYEQIKAPNFSKYIVLDFETTGFSPAKDKILEIGAIKVIDNQIKDKFETLINPQKPIPPFISSKIHITDDMVKGKPKIEDIFYEFINFLDDYPLVIHNARFDMSFLISNGNNFNIKIKNTALDTVSATRTLFPDLKKYNLNHLCNYFGIFNMNAHRAMSDVMATYQLYLILYEKYLSLNS